MFIVLIIQLYKFGKKKFAKLDFHEISLASYSDQDFLYVIKICKITSPIA